MKVSSLFIFVYQFSVESGVSDAVLFLLWGVEGVAVSLLGFWSFLMLLGAAGI